MTSHKPVFGFTDLHTDSERAELEPDIYFFIMPRFHMLSAEFLRV